jgi:hypothetical protein
MSNHLRLPRSNMYRLTIASIAAALATCETIKSPSTEYELVRRIDKRGSGIVHIVTNTEGEELVLKCGPPHQEQKYIKEYIMMGRLESKSWSVKPVEQFMNGTSPCVVMELLGSDMKGLRKASTKTWPMTTVASIGIAMIDALIDLHFNYHLVHSDLHPGNVAVRKNDPTQLVVLDYGDMRAASTPMNYRTDLMDAMLSLRYYVDAMGKFSVAKQYSYKKAEVCAGIPKELCDAIDMVHSSKGSPILKESYEEIRAMLVELMAKEGVQYTGKIHWDTESGETIPAANFRSIKKKKVKDTREWINKPADKNESPEAPKNDAPNKAPARSVKAEEQITSTTTKSTQTIMSTCFAVALLAVLAI